MRTASSTTATSTSGTGHGQHARAAQRFVGGGQGGSACITVRTLNGACVWRSQPNQKKLNIQLVLLLLLCRRFKLVREGILEKTRQPAVFPGDTTHVVAITDGQVRHHRCVRAAQTNNRAGTFLSVAGFAIGHAIGLYWARHWARYWARYCVRHEWIWMWTRRCVRRS